MQGSGEVRDAFSAKLLSTLLLTATMLFVLPLSAHAAKSSTVTVKNSAVRATMGKKQWSFNLSDKRGTPILQERPGSGPGPIGRLGFEVNGSWKHATRVKKIRKSGRGRLLMLATTDPTRDLAVNVSPASHGSIRLRAAIAGSLTGVEKLGMSFLARAGERYLGFGERSNAVDQRGSVVENWTGEGPYESDEYNLIKSYVPDWALRKREDATYFPMPWLLSTSGYGVLVENTEPSYFHLATDRSDTWRVELSRTVDGLPQQPEDRPSPDSITLRFFPGPEPADVVRRLSGALGRQPAPEPFFFGPWVQPKGSPAATVDTLTSSDIPTSLLQTYLHYLPCQHQVGQEQAQRDFTSEVHSKGMAVTAYFNPMLCTDRELFNSLGAAGQLTEDKAGIPYEYNYLSYHVGQFDFTSQAARDSYGALLREALDHGYDGWMEDFGEYTPPDSVSWDGTPGMVEHNRYPMQYHCAAHDQTKSHSRTVARFTRSGYTGSAACSPIVWGGDPNTEWGFDGLSSAIQNGLSMGLSGVGVWGSDIGGFFSISSDPLSPELLSRWVQFGAFSGVMRNQADGLHLNGSARPQVLDPDQVANWRRYSKIRTQLYPYISGAARQYRESGLPMMRAMVLEFPNDRKATSLEDQYMFGDDLLVAPITQPGQTSRRVYLPKGRWIDFWRTFGYDEATGAISLNDTRFRNGGGWRTIPAPAAEIPLLARAGALITTVDSDVDTLSPFGEDPSIIHLSDRNSRNLFAFPRGNSTARFEESGKVTSRELKRLWELEVSDVQGHPWTINADLDTLKRPFKVRCVKLNGRKLPRGGKVWQATGKQIKITLPTAPRKFKLKMSARGC